MVEAVVAAIVLVPLALALLDLTVVVIANSMNDTAAKNAARAAANQPDGNSAMDAATRALKSFKDSGFITSIIINDLKYADVMDAVTVQTKMVVHLPVPFPGISDITFMADDVEPIVVKDK